MLEITLDSTESWMTHYALSQLADEVRTDIGQPGADYIGHTPELLAEIEGLAARIYEHGARPVRLDNGDQNLVVSALSYEIARLTRLTRRPGAAGRAAADMGGRAQRLLDRIHIQA